MFLLEPKEPTIHSNAESIGVDVESSVTSFIKWKEDEIKRAGKDIRKLRHWIIKAISRVKEKYPDAKWSLDVYEYGGLWELTVYCKGGELWSIHVMIDEIIPREAREEFLWISTQQEER